MVGKDFSEFLDENDFVYDDLTIKEDISILEIEAEKKKENKICKICNKAENEIEFVKGRCFCKGCYKISQKNKMKERRNI